MLYSMLSVNQCNELRDHLQRAQNPLFYYDNDADGLCSFLLFARYLGRGKGVAVRSYPDLNASYARKAVELGADVVFILDKPIVSPEFISALRELAIPVIWIDHHALITTSNPELFESVSRYNPLEGEESSNEPVTYWAQQVCGRMEDIWIAVMGCIADHYLPDFAQSFAKEYPELWGKGIKKPFDAYYKTEIGTIARALNFGLKDSVSHVVKLQQYLLTCTSPSAVFADVSGNAHFRATYGKLMKRYEGLLREALQTREGNLLFFTYGGETSMSSELSNELVYRSQGCYIVVAYSNAGITNLSLRGENVRAMLERILPKLTHASGGGHADAVGARISSGELALFRELFEHEVTHASA